MKKKVGKLLLILFIFISPIIVLAYDKVIPGGETIGIEVHSKGVLIVGFYKVDNKLIGEKAGFKVGDIITKINNIEVNNINEMMNEINNSSNNTITFTIKRKNKYKNISLDLINENNTLKTGLYVKDSITGLGTLSFILEDRKFASLGHEILENNTKEKFEIDYGEIYDASVTGIIKSYNGNAGEKNASYDKSSITGIITDNDITGIYGEYNKDTDREYIDVGNIDDIKLGEASIKTVIENDTVGEYSIKIIDIDKNNETKNILFEITDEELLNKTGGVIQGMSGSPIIQNNKMIGVVNYVIVNEPSKGYGIFLTTMLEEIE